MKVLIRFFISILLGAFGLFLTSPIFALSNQIQNVIVLSSNFSDTCTSNLQCEVLSDGQYFCHSGTENISNQGGIIRHVPASKSGDATASSIICQVILGGEYITRKLISYIGPDTYIYPFVGITKIQV